MLLLIQYWCFFRVVVVWGDAVGNTIVVLVGRYSGVGDAVEDAVLVLLEELQ